MEIVKQEVIKKLFVSLFFIVVIYVPMQGVLYVVFPRQAKYIYFNDNTKREMPIEHRKPCCFKSILPVIFSCILSFIY